MAKEKGLISGKQQILSEAARLFHANGFVGTSLQPIGKKVGMEGPSLYNHISSKNEILTLLLLENTHLFNTRMKEINNSFLTNLEKIEQEKKGDIAKGVVKFLVYEYDETSETVAIATILTMIKKKTKHELRQPEYK